MSILIVSPPLPIIKPTFDPGTIISSIPSPSSPPPPPLLEPIPPYDGFGPALRNFWTRRFIASFPLLQNHENADKRYQLTAFHMKIKVKAILKINFTPRTNNCDKNLSAQKFSKFYISNTQSASTYAMAAAVPVRVQTRSGFPPSANICNQFHCKKSNAKGKF